MSDKPNEEQVTENKKRLDELFERTKDLPKLTNKQLRAKLTKLTNEEAPDTTHAWLVEAVARHLQLNYYNEHEFLLPEKVVQNNKAFFAAPIPDKQEEEKKMNSRKGKKRATSKKVDARTLRWIKDASTDIEKQKKEHIRLMLTVIHEAGEQGVPVKDLEARVEKKLSADGKTAWSKCSVRTHVNWLLKRFSDCVETLEESGS